ncbi:MAG: hypothetical protein PHG00_09600 [Methylococcales bacterium]|nr:hypothetical protein [Methylococcales bacterium]
MNNHQRKDYPLLARKLVAVIFVVFFNMAAVINSPAQAADSAPPSNNDIDCLLNWAQTFYPSLFSPQVSGLQFSAPYTYRYYPGSNTYVGVSSADNHVYYLGPDGVLQDEGDLSVWLAASGCGPRPYPVIFIHGLASSADTWIAYRNYLVNSGHWIFGGVPAYSQATKTVNISCPSNPGQTVSCTGGTGDFYTLNFSDSQGLSFDEQGGELAAIIKAVLDANPGKKKVILISHSAGTLAARGYLQGLARELNSATTIPYRDDVIKFITVGAPHQGSFWAAECRNNADVCNFVSPSIDPNSIAIEDLISNSPALNTLNDLITHPLPSNIFYVSIIGTGQSTLNSLSLTDFKDGDGIVTTISQDLSTITGNLPFQQKSVRIDIPFRECGNTIDVPPIGNIGETHTCETTDIGVGAEILRDLQ